MNVWGARQPSPYMHCLGFCSFFSVASNKSTFYCAYKETRAFVILPVWRSCILGLVCVAALAIIGARIPWEHLSSSPVHNGSLEYARCAYYIMRVLYARCNFIFECPSTTTLQPREFKWPSSNQILWLSSWFCFLATARFSRAVKEPQIDAT